MRAETASNTVAIYWDFENLHASLYERDWGGSRSYADNRYNPQEVLVNIKAVVDYAASIGDVAINRAYNNWQWFSRYRDPLNIAGLDLIQIYPKGPRGKNGADIRLALDVLEDVFRYPKITHVIIISSDSDFVSLAQKLKQSGLTVIGIGVQQATNFFWAQNCDEFRYYDTLLGMIDDVEPRVTAEEAEQDENEPAVKAMSLDDARKLMLDALRRLVARKGEEQVPKSGLKDMMKRMDSTFDEANLGFVSFSSFIKAFAEIIEDIPDDSGGKVRLRSASERARVRNERVQVATVATEQDYELILKRGNVQLSPCPWWREAVQIVDEIFRNAPQQQLTSFDDLEGELGVRLNAAGLDCAPEMVHKLRAFLFALRQFNLGKEKHRIGLKVSGQETLLHGVEREIVRRIVKFAAPPVAISKVAAILYGEATPDKLAAAQELIDHFARKAS